MYFLPIPVNMENNMNLIVYDVMQSNIFDITKYFNDFKIAEIGIIKFIKSKKNQDYGNIHISINKWYNNNLFPLFWLIPKSVEYFLLSP